MATKSIASTSPALTLKQKADIIRAREAAARLEQHPDRTGTSFFERLGYAQADFMNGFGTMSDAYKVRRAERE